MPLCRWGFCIGAKSPSWATDADLITACLLKDARDWPQGSDHVPVCVELRV